MAPTNKDVDQVAKAHLDTRFFQTFLVSYADSNSLPQNTKKWKITDLQQAHAEFIQLLHSMPEK